MASDCRGILDLLQDILEWETEARQEAWWWAWLALQAKSSTYFHLEGHDHQKTLYHNTIQTADELLPIRENTTIVSKPVNAHGEALGYIRDSGLAS